MDKDNIELTSILLQSITAEQAWHYGILPKQCQSDLFEFYSFNDENTTQKIEELEILFGKRIIFNPMPEEELKKYLARYYTKNKKHSGFERYHLSFAPGGNNKSNDFLYNLISDANNLYCSDIHIEIYDNDARIRFRIDGKLFERCIIKKDDYPALINQVKILSNLDIAEKRLPQDGRIQFKAGTEIFDIRVSIVPGTFGEKVVMRLLRKSGSEISIDRLGLNPFQMESYLTGIKKPHGLVLISGPTGSGKTTTLYATLNVLNKKEINVLTIEDPVEYTIEGINQVQLREDIGLTFARALKTFLRQDPDIIMLGEIRDQETAQMAIRASLTGHLVLSTIHTNSAWGIVTRLLDMGIPSFLLASTINMVVAQRLLRKLCPKCKEVAETSLTISPAVNSDLDSSHIHFAPVGCESCFNTGYYGRIAVYEVINIDTDLRESIRQSKHNIDNYMKKKRIYTLSESSVQLYNNGITSYEEIFPIISNPI